MELDLSLLAPTGRPADPKPLGTGSRIFLGTLGLAAVPALAYGAKRLYDHLYPEVPLTPEQQAQLAAASTPKMASITPLTLRDAQGPSLTPEEYGVRVALARYGL